MCLGFVACGGNTDKSDDNGGNKGSETTLKVTINGDSDEEIVLNSKLQKAFVEKKAKEGVTVKFSAPSTFAAGTYQQDLNNLEAGRSLGDVIFAYDDKSGLNLSGDVFEALDSYIENDKDFDLSLYDKDIMDSARTYDNKIAYMPRSYDQVTLFINKAFFKKIDMGDRVPSKELYGENWENWTWKEFTTLLKDMREKLDEKYGESASSYYPLDADFFWNPIYNAVIRSFGGNCVDIENMDSGFNPNHPQYQATLKALDFMNDLVEKKYTPAGDGQFGNGKYEGMRFTTRPVVAGMLGMDKKTMDLAFAPVPKFTKETTGTTDEPTTYVSFGSSGYALNKNSKNKQLAWEFIKFTASEEGQKIIAATGSCVPVIASQKKSDADWTKIEGLEGVDQSAFIFEGNKKIVATYARGVNVKYETAIYTDTKNYMSTSLGKDDYSAASLASKIYTKTKPYIKK